MNLLAIDTSTDILAVALKTDSGWAEASLDLGLKHAERLMSLVDFCLSQAGLAPGELDLLSCAAGPGSFTGLRIGMATVKGMSLALGIPFVAVPTLDCLAWGFEDFPGAVVPLIDGKKGRVYTAIYERGARRSDWLDIQLDHLFPLLDAYSQVLVTGPDADLLEESATERNGYSMDGRATSSVARGLAMLAERQFAEKGASSHEEGPLYLRPSEAEETAREKESMAAGQGRPVGARP
jgi:tRNA threonylcarbamoyladenosine biosynthesis protein TsaB